MSIAFNDRIQGLWYVGWDSGDWMAAVESLDDCAKIIYRFRWYRDHKVFDSDDVKSWYEATGDDIAKAIEAVNTMARGLEQINGGKSYQIMRGTLTTKEMFEQVKLLPFVHSQTVTKQ